METTNFHPVWSGQPPPSLSPSPAHPALCTVTGPCQPAARAPGRGRARPSKEGRRGQGQGVQRQCAPSQLHPLAALPKGRAPQHCCGQTALTSLAQARALKGFPQRGGSEPSAPVSPWSAFTLLETLEWLGLCVHLGRPCARAWPTVCTSMSVSAKCD